MAAIEACRTPRLGGHVDACNDCGLTRVSYNSCPNRHCPKCKGTARKQWVAAHIADLLPVPYFHVVFTLPPAVAEIAFQNKAVVYALLMRISAETANSRIVELDDDHLAFRWKDYRRNGCDREKIMCPQPHEFIRRFLLHLLPAGFHHMRHFGFLANSHRRDRIALCRMLLGQPSPPGGQSHSSETPRGKSYECPDCRRPMRRTGINIPPVAPASTLIFPVRHVMMPNTRYFQKCPGRQERSLSGHERQFAGSRLIAATAAIAIPSVTTLPSVLLFP
nr:transposase zinc-binding domain-containing protein [Sinorhizobium meliloti]